MNELENMNGYPELKYPIGARVWHLSDTDAGNGIVIDASFSYNTGKVKYLVSFGATEHQVVWCSPIELCEEKPFEL